MTSANTDRDLGGAGATGIGVATLVSAASGYCILLVAARSLTPTENAQFLTFWSLLFGLFGVLAGLQNEVTRSVRSAANTSTGVRVLPTALLVGVVLGLAVAGSSPLWAGRTFAAWPTASTLVIGVAVVAFAGHVGSAGAVAGAGRWSAFSLLVGGEASVRLALVALTVIVGYGLEGLQVAAALAAGTWIGMSILVPGVRRAWSERSDVDLSPFLRRIGHAMIAASATSALVVGFPLLLRVTTDDSVYKDAAPLILAISMTRAPLLMPLGVYQGVAITHFIDHPERVIGYLRRIAAVIALIAILGSGLAAWVGPRLMTAFFGASYAVAPHVLAALTGAAGLLAVLTLSGSAVLAMGMHRAFAIGWTTATLTSIGVLLVPMELSTRAVVSLVLGPLVGIAVHILALRKTRHLPQDSQSAARDTR